MAVILLCLGKCTPVSRGTANTSAPFVFTFSHTGNTAGLIEALEAEAEARHASSAGGEGITGSELGSRAAREEATRKAERAAKVCVFVRVML
jgi:hypothetical protein